MSIQLWIIEHNKYVLDTSINSNNQSIVANIGTGFSTAIAIHKLVNLEIKICSEYTYTTTNIPSEDGHTYKLSQIQIG